MGVVMSVHISRRPAEQVVEQLGLGGDLVGNGSLVELSKEGFSPKSAIGKEAFVAADEAGGLPGDQRQLSAIGQYEVKSDLEVGSIRQQGDGRAGVFAGDRIRLVAVTGPCRCAADHSSAGVEADAEVVGRDDQSEVGRRSWRRAAVRSGWWLTWQMPVTWAALSRRWAHRPRGSSEFDRVFDHTPAGGLNMPHGGGIDIFDQDRCFIDLHPGAPGRASN